MEGTGSTVIESGATGSIAENMFFYIAERTLVNEGSLTVPLKATIVGREGAAVVNHGTLTVNGEGEYKGMLFESPGPEPTLTNTGTVQKTEGSGTTPIRFAIDNEGTISTTSGELEFTGGGTSGAEKSGSWLAGTGAAIAFRNASFALGAAVPLAGVIDVEQGSITAGKVEGATAKITLLNSGKFTVNGPATFNGGKSDIGGYFGGVRGLGRDECIVWRRIGKHGRHWIDCY